MIANPNKNLKIECCEVMKIVVIIMFYFLLEYFFFVRDAVDVLLILFVSGNLAWILCTHFLRAICIQGCPCEMIC